MDCCGRQFACGCGQDTDWSRMRNVRGRRLDTVTYESLSGQVRDWTRTRQGNEVTDFADVAQTPR